MLGGERLQPQDEPGDDSGIRDCYNAIPIDIALDQLDLHPPRHNIGDEFLAVRVLERIDDFYAELIFNGDLGLRPRLDPLDRSDGQVDHRSFVDTLPSRFERCYEVNKAGSEGIVCLYPVGADPLNAGHFQDIRIIDDRSQWS